MASTLTRSTNRQRGLCRSLLSRPLPTYCYLCRLHLLRTVPNIGLTQQPGVLKTRETNEKFFSCESNSFPTFLNFENGLIHKGRVRRLGHSAQEPITIPTTLSENERSPDKERKIGDGIGAVEEKEKKARAGKIDTWKIPNCQYRQTMSWNMPLWIRGGSASGLETSKIY
ncbi:hypothetical protein RRG08_048658 [Elysia crispata]|uniref:Uncharacterized protein n=1 Tax=Elysia crispata TaxID=231223 RepID=A0AAE1ACU9_9GAST|nr:hypothetical protein RRG08_048658 [Elysia crispata]